MTGPNMATITASLERSLQNCSLNNHHYHHHQSSSSSNSSTNSNGGGGGGGGGISRTSSSDITNNSEATLELNSHVSMPYHWEQCLDLKSGEIYYINWRTGMKAKEDPRMTTTTELSGDFYTEDDSSYDSEGSSTESSPSSSTDHYYHNTNNNINNNINVNVNINVNERCNERSEHVLVVGGCKSCLMYFMVPRHVEDCPKCCGQLLHFDSSQNGSP